MGSGQNTPIGENGMANGTKRAHGGYRPGAGRKPFPATILKRRLIENHVEEAEASFAYLVAVRDNESEPGAVRLAAAEAILDRVLGKPAQGTPKDLPESAQKLIETYYKSLSPGGHEANV